jgi:hypothetical protein
LIGKGEVGFNVNIFYYKEYVLSTFNFNIAVIEKFSVEDREVPPAIVNFLISILSG